MTRGALTPSDIEVIFEHRTRARPTPWSALALQLGRCESDIKAALGDVPVQPIAPPVSREARKGAKAASTSPRLTESQRQEFWSHERITQLFTLYILGPKSAAETAAALGCTRNAVCSKAKRFGGKLYASPVRRAA